MKFECNIDPVTRNFFFAPIFNSRFPQSECTLVVFCDRPLLYKLRNKERERERERERESQLRRLSERNGSCDDQ